MPGPGSGTVCVDARLSEIMKSISGTKRIRTFAGTLVLCIACVLLSSCASVPSQDLKDSQNAAQMKMPNSASTGADEYAGYLSINDDEPDTVDFQCTSQYYNVALNVFDRLVEMEVSDDGSTRIVPSLAESWTVSDDGLVYTFHLHEDVYFSNGEELTSDDVLYTFNRLLTHPDSVNRDLVMDIKGALSLIAKKESGLYGFQIIDKHNFQITLEQPNSSFLACLSTAGASIMDKASANSAGNLFGTRAEWTIGTGPFIIKEWKPGTGMVLAANPDCWSGAPLCDGVYIHFIPDKETQRTMFDQNKLDILDLDNIGFEAEYILHGDIYQEHLVQGPRVGITFIALNEDVEPLDDVNVRKALTLALDRHALLTASYSGRGQVENGIYPRGLIGYDPDLPEIPYDPVLARELLLESGNPTVALTISIPDNTSDNVKEIVNLVSYMWHQVGVNCKVEELESSEFLTFRKNGELACYIDTWSASYNDPENFIYTFFGSRDNTMQRSLNYPNEDIMRRVYEARSITDEDERIAEYQYLQKKIVQEDAAWIPLLSRQHYFLLSDRVEGFKVSWNGWSANQYHNVSVSPKEE